MYRTLLRSTGVYICEDNCWFRRSLWSYSLSAYDYFKPQLQIAMKLFHHPLISIIKNFRKLTECFWLQHCYLHTFNSTQKWTELVKRENGFKIVINSWKRKIDHRPLSIVQILIQTCERCVKLGSSAVPRQRSESTTYQSLLQSENTSHAAPLSPWENSRR